MRIAYVAIHLGQDTMKGGVGYKIQTQLRLWHAMGHEACLFLHTPDEIKLEHTASFQYSFDVGPGLIGLLQRERNRSRALAQMIRAVEDYHPDLIYLRYGLFALPLQRLFRIAPVVVEINTNDVEEYHYRGEFYYWMNRLSRGQTLGCAAGLIAVSHEIANLAENMAFRRPTTVIANGIDLEQVVPLPAPANSRPRLTLVGSPGYDWHGVDQLVELTRICPDLDIDIIGYSPQNVPQTGLANLRLHGFLAREQVRSTLAQADIACGTLALYRKKMEEASPLKVREALALGIPTLLAYTDTDLHGHNFPFLFTIPNQEGSVVAHAAQIRAFAYAMRGIRADREALRPLIDQQVKEEQRLAFFASLRG